MSKYLNTKQYDKLAVAYQMKEMTFAEILDAAIDMAKGEPVAKVRKNSSGQISLVDGSGDSFDIYKHVGATFYAITPLEQKG